MRHACKTRAIACQRLEDIKLLAARQRKKPSLSSAPSHSGVTCLAGSAKRPKHSQQEGVSCSQQENVAPDQQAGKPCTSRQPAGAMQAPSQVRRSDCRVRHHGTSDWPAVSSWL